MSHLLILPILIPLFAGALLLIGHRRPPALQRAFSLAATAALLPLAIWAVGQAETGSLQFYALGNWQPPFGIVLMLDRLSAMMLLLTAVLALPVLLYACAGDDRRGVHFHALFQFQLLGINGAFLTGDLFNLFVFFEILLIASYALLVHGNGERQVKAGMAYVVLNLVGSSLFLLGVGTLYGLLGSLNMADLAARIAQAPEADAPLLEAAGYLLLVVFGLKAAILPLHFWLARAYAAAPAPVAALFAIMTKVGLYAILRVFSLLYGSQAGSLAGLGQDLLWWLALGGVAFGVIGALGARSLSRLLAYLVLVSVGTLLAGIAMGSPQGLTASLYYLVHSTLVAGGLFLLAGLVAAQRGEQGGELIHGPGLRQPLLLGALFFAGAIAVAGLPPLSGFLGKLLLLQAASPQQALSLWPVLLLGGLGMLLALSRAGSTLFWRAGDAPLAGRDHPLPLLATLALLLCSPLLVVFAGSLTGYAEATARQLLDTTLYLGAGGGA